MSAKKKPVSSTKEYKIAYERGYEKGYQDAMQGKPATHNTERVGKRTVR